MRPVRKLAARAAALACGLAKETAAMAHALVADPLATPAAPRNSDLDTPEIRAARVDLAACFRMAARLGMHEGICNHFSLVVPGCADLMLVNPYGWAFAEITASRLLVCDFHGHVVAGEGVPEPTAFFIHARLHMAHPRARAAFHTHMPHATALAMTEGPPLVWAGQTALKFHGRVMVDEDYNGLALDEHEGDRIAAALGDADVVFMKNHGVMVVGASAAEAWDDLYYLERAAEAQLLALSTGRALKPVPEDVALRTSDQMREGGARESARLHLESVKRQLARLEPDFLD